MNYYSQAHGVPPPAASLRVGGQQDLETEELETMKRITGLEETFLKTNIHQHRVSHLPAVSLREGGGQQDLAPKELEAIYSDIFIVIILSLEFYWENFIVIILSL